MASATKPGTRRHRDAWELAEVATHRLGGLLDAYVGVKPLVASAFEIVVHVGRTVDGAIKVHSIEEISGVSDAGFETVVLFQLRDGAFAATGTVPRFYTELEARGIPADQAGFR